MKHLRTQPYRSPTNGNAERFNRTLADGFPCSRKFHSEADRRVRLARCVHDYDCHRHHTAVGGPPASRAHYLTRTDIRV
ncbi:integrase core domain-containing protein [Candidatus Poriferisodalis sp.]|uniref:integrase core domain-containing protein n=1 Tax=Candidatus Poriferisodalis sp. TaxID=3101277 RepID=UPI003B016BBE